MTDTKDMTPSGEPDTLALQTERDEARRAAQSLHEENQSLRTAFKKADTNHQEENQRHNTFLLKHRPTYWAKWLGIGAIPSLGLGALGTLTLTKAGFLPALLSALKIAVATSFVAKTIIAALTNPVGWALIAVACVIGIACIVKTILDKRKTSEINRNLKEVAAAEAKREETARILTAKPGLSTGLIYGVIPPGASPAPASEDPAATPEHDSSILRTEAERVAPAPESAARTSPC